MWADYWELSSRLARGPPGRARRLLRRWPGTYVEDRLRNDWLLELGKRRDWANFAREYPRFRMNDDREVTCYALLARTRPVQDVAEPTARAAWLAQRDADDGCQLLAARCRGRPARRRPRSGSAGAVGGGQPAARRARRRALLGPGRRRPWPSCWTQPGALAGSAPAPAWPAPRRRAGHCWR
jgi:hypothetical protein